MRKTPKQLTTNCFSKRTTSLLVIAIILFSGLGPIGPAVAQPAKSIIPTGLGAKGPYSQEILQDPAMASWVSEHLRGIFQKEVNNPAFTYIDADFIVAGKQNGSYTGYILISSSIENSQKKTITTTTWKANISGANRATNQFNYVWAGPVSSSTAPSGILSVYWQYGAYDNGWSSNYYGAQSTLTLSGNSYSSNGGTQWVSWWQGFTDTSSYFMQIGFIEDTSVKGFWEIIYSGSVVAWSTFGTYAKGYSHTVSITNDYLQTGINIWQFKFDGGVQKTFQDSSYQINSGGISDIMESQDTTSGHFQSMVGMFNPAIQRYAGYGSYSNAPAGYVWQSSGTGYTNPPKGIGIAALNTNPGLSTANNIWIGNGTLAYYSMPKQLW